MVFTVGICDDSPEQVELLIQYLNSHAGYDDLTLVRSTDPEKFMSQLEEARPHLVFLDIDMGEINGIQLGEKIKALYENTVIIYITAHEKYALQAYQVRAFHYLLKPLTREKFDQALDEALSIIKKNHDEQPVKMFSIQVKGEIISLRYSDIYYFEKVGHRIKIHTEGRDIFFYETLYNLLGNIDHDSFIQCHQGYVVNTDKIRSYRDKNLFLDKKLQVPVSRPFIEAVKEKLASRLFAGKERP